MVHFEENFTLIKNMPMTCNFYFRNVVKMILNDGSNFLQIGISASLHLMEMKSRYMGPPSKTTSFTLLKMEFSKIDVFRKSNKGLALIIIAVISLVEKSKMGKI